MNEVCSCRCGRIQPVGIKCHCEKYYYDNNGKEQPTIGDNLGPLIAPEPRYEYGQYHYGINCPICNWHTDSDKGMTGPERDYLKHWQKEHRKKENNPPSNSSFSTLIPTLQLAHDSTSIGEAKLCWQKYKYSIIDGYEPRDTNVHFYFGHEYHHSLEYYDYLRAEGLNYKDSVLAVVQEIFVRTWDSSLSRPWTSGDIYKNQGTLIRSVIWYLAQFGQDDSLETIILPSGKPAVELHFDIDIGFVSRLTREPFRLVGHLDKLASFNDQPVIIDRKTTKFQITQSFFDRFNPDNQVSTYLVGANSFAPPDSPVLSMIIDAAQVLVQSTKFQRGIVSRTPAQLDEWIRDLFVLFQEFERRVESNHWPMNDKACGLPHTDPKTGETRYGCPFRDVCAADPSMRELLLKAGFNRRTWDPAKPRELERQS